jgi:hypothetical protein
VIRSNRVHRACIWSSDAPVLAARFSDDARTRRLKLPKLQQATQQPERLYRTIAALEANPREQASSIAWLPFRRKIESIPSTCGCRTVWVAIAGLPLDHST